MKIYFLGGVLVASVNADVSNISNEYLPPTSAAAASAPVQTYSAPVSAPSSTASEQSFDVAAPSVLAEPEYLPPAASSPSVEYLPPSYQSETYAPAASHQSGSDAEPSYAESAPGHTFSSNDGYRSKPARPRAYRRRAYRHRLF
ncbi:adhesive plaque matrix protein-like [Bactrocera dorsalis]|uniref:Adhesive plaque matrix protein-like n=1 Tax=Bactrocera dorsalis TaxID=27457 RepID=A0ABM3JWH9_BACDO|nr:adhesive plaque matrix protein-like [Bactrocera dorsalis]